MYHLMAQLLLPPYSFMCLPCCYKWYMFLDIKCVRLGNLRLHAKVHENESVASKVESGAYEQPPRLWDCQVVLLAYHYTKIIPSNH